MEIEKISRFWELTAKLKTVPVTDPQRQALEDEYLSLTREYMDYFHEINQGLTDSSTTISLIWPDPMKQPAEFVKMVLDVTIDAFKKCDADTSEENHVEHMINRNKAFAVIQQILANMQIL